jgi:hypothetical protein
VVEIKYATGTGSTTSFYTDYISHFVKKETKKSWVFRENNTETTWHKSLHNCQNGKNLILSECGLHCSLWLWFLGSYKVKFLKSFRNIAIFIFSVNDFGRGVDSSYIELTKGSE